MLSANKSKLKQFNQFNTIAAERRIRTILGKTRLTWHKRLSEKYGCSIYLKREDEQPVRSYKIRGAYNKIAWLCESSKPAMVVCASAGNHAQGVAYSCVKLGINAVIFMPVNTPVQKISRVKQFGGNNVEIRLQQGTYDDAALAAIKYSKENNLPYIAPFDDQQVIEGQSTIAIELLSELENIDYVFMPVGGGGLAAGLGIYFNEYSAATKLIGVEPSGAASMQAAFMNNGPIHLEKINSFIDGAAVSRVGELNYKICRITLASIQTVDEGRVCSNLLTLYNEDGIVAEPAGVLSIAALDDFAEKIKGKTVVCILSGSNNDSNRMDEIKKLALEWEGLQHYLIIRFGHNPDGLKEFFVSMLGNENFVNRIEYLRRDHGRSTYALLGIRSNNLESYHQLLQRLKDKDIEYTRVNENDFLFKYWV